MKISDSAPVQVRIGSEAALALWFPASSAAQEVRRSADRRSQPTSVFRSVAALHLAPGGNRSYGCLYQ